MIRNYSGPDREVAAAVTVLEIFIGDMDNAELADDSTVDTAAAAKALDLLIGKLNPLYPLKADHDD